MENQSMFINAEVFIEFVFRDNITYEFGLELRPHSQSLLSL